MPTYKYEALDTSGNEVKDSVEATNEIIKMETNVKSSTEHMKKEQNKGIFD